MIAQKTMVTAIDADGKWAYRLGGITAFILVIGWLATFPVYAYVGTSIPTGVEARLAYYGGHQTGWWAILGLMVATDLLYVAIALALYQSLKRIDQNMILLAMAGKGLFVVLDLAVLWPAKVALFTLGGDYVAAATDVQRATLVAAAAAPSAVLDSLLPAVFSILMPSLGTLFASLAMLKGVFSRRTAYLGLVVAITGIIAVADPLMGAMGKWHIVNALLATGWYLLVGWRLYKLGRK